MTEAEENGDDKQYSTEVSFNVLCWRILEFCDIPLRYFFLSSMQITYIGFKGKGMNVKRQAVDAVYEAVGMKSDHAVADAHTSRFGV